eukprot:TRINITY_DN11664_c0_g1_i1.p1 TRINITY_DN11664_c0_g1~~TRINITY_DN11664_c0_g1_i1.p1  ORF type:complete len:477 (-),score=118.02 TRINITY_DN11664_c0_g1_i1:96-1526(-)
MLLLIGVLAILAIYFLFLRPSTPDTPEIIDPYPQLEGRPVAQAEETLEMITGGRIHDLLMETAQEYGPVAKISYDENQRPIVLVTGQKYLRSVFNSKEVRARIPEQKVIDPTELTYEGIARQTGDKWKALRRLMAPGFTKKLVLQKSPVVEKGIQSLMTKLNNICDSGESEVDIQHHIKFLTMEVISHIAFGIQYSFQNFDQHHEKLLEILNDIVEDGHNRFFSSDIDHDPKLKELRLERIAWLTDFVDLVLSTGDYTNSDNMLRVLDQSNLTGIQVKHQIYTIFLAGFETSSIAITWALIELSRNIDICEELHKEIVRVFGDEDITADKLEECTLLKQVWIETLRRYPPAPFIPRFIMEDVKILDTELHAGGFIFLSPYVVHLSEENYENPLVWDPSRWNDDNFKQANREYRFMPFGGGVRKCLGLELIMVEARLSLANMIRSFKFSIIGDENIGINTKIVLYPDRDVMMAIERR